MARIQMRGDEKVKTYLIELPRKIDRELSKGNLTFMKNVKKSAKLRAPRHSGDLADSIVLDVTRAKGKNKQWMIIVNSPYGIYQEFGFKPHFINAGWSTKNSFGTVGNAFGWSFEVAKVSKSKPFLMPALDANIVSFDKILNDSLDKAIK